jgi:hypothetical protein
VRITVVPPDTDLISHYISKSGAQSLIRRLLAVRIDRKSIRMLKTVYTNIPDVRQERIFVTQRYEHHLEPAIIRLTPEDSEWLRFMRGW